MFGALLPGTISEEMGANISSPQVEIPIKSNSVSFVGMSYRNMGEKLLTRVETTQRSPSLPQCK